MSPENKALVERECLTREVQEMLANFMLTGPWVLNRLLDAARSEGSKLLGDVEEAEVNRPAQELDLSPSRVRRSLQNLERRDLIARRYPGQAAEALSCRPSREEYERTIIDVLDKWHDGSRERKAREITDALLALFSGVGGEERSGKEISR